MPEYGLTRNGPNIKRLDVILEEMHTDLSKRWGVNTRQNPESLLNDLLTTVADKLAELWELGEGIYYSMYPATAEGLNLDNAAQFGGTTREDSAKSYYPIHCTGIDGTVLEAGTLISTSTNPRTELSITDARTITRAACNKAVLRVAALTPAEPYVVIINGTIYSAATDSVDQVEVLTRIAESLNGSGFTATVDEDTALLILEAEDIASTNELILSESLTTETVTSIITFGTVETGNILIPEGAIEYVTKADAGLLSVINLCTYIAGHDKESDASLRKSYADKIFNRSANMLESIRSAILQNVQGVISVAPYENPSHEWDDWGRPPHSVEIVVDGGDSREIATQILKNKAGGIITHGDTVVVLPGEYDEDITIRFNRPQNVYVWFRLGITVSRVDGPPPNYADLLREAVLANVVNMPAGEDVVPQHWVSGLHSVCTGIDYIDVRLFYTENREETPKEFNERTAPILIRQKVYTDETMIEVEIDG